LIAPLQVLFRWGGEETEEPGRVGAVAFDQIVGIHHILQGFGHFFRLADNDLLLAVDAPPLLYLVGIEKSVGPAFHRFLADHALGEEIGERLVGADDPEITEDLGVEP